MKYKVFFFLIIPLLFWGCIDQVKHSHSYHALQSQEFIIQALNIEDSLLLDGYKEQYISLMEKAVEESKYAERHELNGIYPNWGNWFHDYLIQGARLTIDGESEEDIGESFRKLNLAREYINNYGDWFNHNIDEMKYVVIELKEE